ncbi:MAG: hypothetical protein EOQ93_31750 [Mesorhizobium sp.]|nr:MAG: hypothetical protein EOQ93_31750 [Mesorhizobium sp.]
MPRKRWHVTVTYNTAKGQVPDWHSVDKLEEIEPIIEDGPDCNAIAAITVRLNQRSYPFGTTVEETMEPPRHLDERQIADFDAMVEFFEDHPPVGDEVDEQYIAAVGRAFPEAAGSLVAVSEFTRRKVTILGLDVVAYEPQPDVIYDEHWQNYHYWTAKVPVVQLPNGKHLALKHPEDLAELRAILKREPAPEDRNKAR